MADRPGQWASARDIAERANVPAALLMNVLKTLQGAGIVQSTRGALGGYRIAADLERLSLFDLVRVLDRHDSAPGANGGEAPYSGRYKIDGSGPHGPVHAFHSKLRQFLRSVMLSDLVLPGRRIDVPVELVRSRKNGIDKTNPISRRQSAALAAANT